MGERGKAEQERWIPGVLVGKAAWRNGAATTERETMAEME